MMYVEYKGVRGIVINEQVLGATGLNLWKALMVDGSTVHAPMYHFVLCTESRLDELKATPIASYGDVE